MNKDNQQHLIQEFDKYVKELKQLDYPYRDGDTETVYFGYKTNRNNEIFTVTDWGNVRKFVEKVYTSAKQEVIEEVEKKIEKLYSGFEDNKPVVFASISEQHYNQGLYQGRLNAMEIVTQDLFGINGDELKSTISSLKESLPAKSEEK